ncbi:MULTISPECIES: hypothetical protein [Bacillus cereus group]|uniref:hypothetical protein n=1 Tax=Bacillus cereus group TaxID=86661 RepID=UPI00177FD2DD|nr:MULTISPECIES: hypothetical protein [Bacillus cereus group]MDR4984854.1 hypothetical protein [Bacillus cereus]MEA1011265.1 hypothetical protein [Bacillus cereus]
MNCKVGVGGIASDFAEFGGVPKNNCGKEQIAIMPRMMKNERITKKQPFFNSDITF